MHNTRPARITSPLISLSQGYVKLVPLGLLVGAIGIGMAFLFSAAASGGYRRFSFAYLTNFSFLLSISLGCLFFVIGILMTMAWACVGMVTAPTEMWVLGSYLA